MKMLISALVLGFCSIGSAAEVVKYELQGRDIYRISFQESPYENIYISEPGEFSFTLNQVLDYRCPSSTTRCFWEGGVTVAGTFHSGGKEESLILDNVDNMPIRAAVFSDYQVTLDRVWPLYYTSHLVLDVIVTRN